MMPSGHPDDFDRLHRLETQVRVLTERIDALCRALDPGSRSHDNIDSFTTTAGNQPRSRSTAEIERLHERNSHPPLPDSRIVRRMIHDRQVRAAVFGEGLFGEPAWDMILDLAASCVEHKRVSISSLCIASGVPQTTALRWISLMIDYGIFARLDDEIDKRRSYVQLTKKGMRMTAIYFERIS